ncbi:MAG: hypothetical protein Kow0065_10310 [Methylomicrobium sp.]
MGAQWIFNAGAPSMALGRFVELLDELDEFGRLLESGLPVYNKVIDGDPVETTDLAQSLKKPEISRLTVFRDDVAEVFQSLGYKVFPWRNLYDEPVNLDCGAYRAIEPLGDEDEPAKILRQNEIARLAAARPESQTHFHFQHVADVLSKPLPAFAKPLSRKHRTELFFYLRLLDEEKSRLLAESPSHWRSDELKKIAAKECEILALAGCEPQAEAPAVESVSRSSVARTRKINLVRAIESAARNLRNQLNKKPSIDELWQYFENDLDETGFIEDYTDTHLTWRTTKGDLKDTPKSTVANHLSRIKI